MSVILLALDPASISKEQLSQVKELAGDRQVVVTDQREEIKKHLDQIEIAAADFPREWVSQAKHLKWFQQWSAGADWLKDHPEAVELDFTLTNASGVHAIPISEHILAFLFAFARGLHRAVRGQQAHDWQKSQSAEAFELAGKVMLLVGVGAIGKRTAEIAACLGMRVWGVRRNPEKSEPGIERMVGQDEFQDLLPEVDILVLTVPDTEETHQMIDHKMLGRMKQSAYLINIGRGGTVDEEALVQALRAGKIAGAGLDVFATEPLPPESPLWDLDNVIITGHTSGSTPHYDERAMKIFIDNLKRYVQNQPLENVVDKELGY
jgi:phosphoglycerate dehydrogenase-like enzyme